MNTLEGKKVIDQKIKTDFLEEIVEASIEMSKSRVGALMIFEKEMGLKN